MDPDAAEAATIAAGLDPIVPHPGRASGADPLALPDPAIPRLTIRQCR